MQIGLATLSQVNLGELQAILAHEFGHYTQHDPFYTRFIFQVTASLDHSLAVMQASAGFMNYINPFFWFYWLYLRAYALLASGFSRSREFLADRRAVSVFGKESFCSGLVKAAVDGHLMEQMLMPNIQAAFQAGETLRNVFEVSRAYTEDAEFPQVREKALEELRGAKPGWFDSHPTYSERLTAIERFTDAPEYSDARPARHLLSEPDEVEVKLTDMLTGIIRDANEMMLAMQQGGDAAG
jgi:Zn-dependent protease with chaperone function